MSEFRYMQRNLLVSQQMSRNGLSNKVTGSRPNRMQKLQKLRTISTLLHLVTKMLNRLINLIFIKNNRHHAELQIRLLSLMVRDNHKYMSWKTVILKMRDTYAGVSAGIFQVLFSAQRITLVFLQYRVNRLQPQELEEYETPGFTTEICFWSFGKRLTDF